MGTDEKPVEGKLLYEALTERIIGAAFKVHNELGMGFLEKVYENALAYELRESGLNVQSQQSLTVRYLGVVVGDYVADLVVEQNVLLEIKAIQALNQSHTAQLLNYLKATGLRVGLLLNFGTPKLQLKRLIL